MGALFDFTFSHLITTTIVKIPSVLGLIVSAPDHVRRLFGEMAATYGVVNLASSFGFCHRWRRQCVSFAPIEQGMAVFDLMSGMGELWPGIAGRARRRVRGTAGGSDAGGPVVVVDASPETRLSHCRG